MNAASLTKTIDRREQFYERWSAYQRVLIHRYTKMKSAQTKLNTPLQLKPAHVSEYEYTEMMDGRYPSTDY